MKNIINKILPDSADNNYKGLKIALYVFILLTVVTLWRSQHHLFSADGGAQSIATIPLDTFTSDGASAVIGVFSLWGLSQLIIGFIYVVVLVKYRSLIPMMYLLMFFEYFVRLTYIGAFKPIPQAGTAPGAIGNIILTIAIPILLALSLFERKE